MQLVLLPGMDGTGELFQAFKHALPSEMDVTVVSYPGYSPLGYNELLEIVQDSVPAGEYVVVAESFSSPLAVKLAAEQPVGLLGLVMCAGFVTCPVRGPMRWLAEHLGPLLFQTGLSRLAEMIFLMGDNPSHGLMSDVLRAVAWVAPGVMSRRLREVLDVDVRKELARVQVPILSLFSANDQWVDLECKREMLMTREMQSVTIDGPHMLLQRAPVLCAKLVMDWVGQLPAVFP